MQEAVLPARHGISRARLFIKLADECEIADKDIHEAFLDAAIIFCRSSMLRLQARYENREGWDKWYAPLLKNPSVMFIKGERNFVEHEAPLKVGQIMYGGSGPAKAKYLYYFKNINEPAIDTVLTHTNGIEKLIREGEMKFGSDDIIRA